MGGRRLNNNLYFCSKINYTIIGMKKDKNAYAQANKNWLVAMIGCGSTLIFDIELLGIN